MISNSNILDHGAQTVSVNEDIALKTEKLKKLIVQPPKDPRSIRALSRNLRIPTGLTP